MADSFIIDALIHQESRGNRNAVSPKGARGIAQVMPDTARNPGFGIKPLQNDSDEEQRRFANDYMDAMLKRYNGNLNLALAAYNAGPGNVDKYGGVPPFKETQNYVKKIVSSLNPMSTADASEAPSLPQGKLSYSEWKAQKKPIQPGKLSYAEWKAQKQNAPITEQRDPGIIDRAAKNLPGDIKNIGEGVINTLSHPIDSLSTLSGLLMGAVANMLPDNLAPEVPQQDKDNAANLGRSIVEGVKHPLETFANKPASTLLNIMGLLSAGGSLVKGTIGKSAKLAASEDAVNVARKNALIKPTIDVLKEAQSKGFVIPQSQVAPRFINNRLEGVAGKAAMNQDVVIRNQKAVSAQARKAIGLAEDQPITGAAIKKAIKDNYKPYEDVAALPDPPAPPQVYNPFRTNNPVTVPTSKALLEELKQSRHDSQAWYKSAQAQGGNPEMIAKAKAASKRAFEIENEFEKRALTAGQPELVRQLKDARKNIAKIYDVDAARNVATGEIDPVIIGRKLDNAPDKITGELKQIGEFQQAFPKFAKAGEIQQTPGVSKIEAVTSIGGGFGGAAVGGPVGGFIGAMLPFASEPVRKLLLSDWYQKRLIGLMESKPSKVKKFMSTATNKTGNKTALLGLIASDKEDVKIIDKMAQGEKK